MKRKIIFNIVLFPFFFLPLMALSQQTFQKTIQIEWKKETLNQGKIPKIQNFSAQEGQFSFVKNIPLPSKPSHIKVKPLFEFDKPLSQFPDSFKNSISDSFNYSHEIGYINKEPKLMLNLTPFKKRNGNLKFIQTLLISITAKPESAKLGKRGKDEWPKASPLALGNWIKLGIDTTGIFKITYQDLKNFNGINPETVNPKNLHIYGNGGQMLPQSLSGDYPKGLREKAIRVKGEEDGSFDKSDYVLFYGRGPSQWNFNQGAKKFKHRNNDYSDSGYYFLTENNQKGKRLSQQQSLNNATYSTDRFDQLQFHEKESLTEINKEIKTGRNWYGETFENQLTRTFDFPLNSGADSVIIDYRLAHRSSFNSNFKLKVNGQGKTISMGALPNINAYDADYIKPKKGSLKIKNTKQNLNFTLSYNKKGNGKGWLDYLSVNARSKLKYTGNQFIFRDQQSVGKEKAQYLIQKPGSSIEVWDVTDPWNNHRQKLRSKNSAVEFIDSAKKLRQFIAFQPQNAYKVNFAGKVQNQNLHGLSPAKMVIVSHKKFKSEAEELANFHRKNDGFNVHVVSPSTIYQEFSSGREDITAIRNFLKMLYDRSDNKGTQPEYLILFGDASYDYKNRIKDNTDLVPTFQSPNCYSPISSFATDDYYGYLDDNEGSMQEFLKGDPHFLDLSIGRIPVNKKSQANAVINKIQNYHNNEKSFGDWQNLITFVADDEDRNRHLRDAETLAKNVENQSPEYNLEKIYLDAYDQKTTPSGTRYPDANDAVNKQINNGTLIFNYIGHGGENGLAHEKILETSDIQSWENGYKLPLFITATCEFSRYDDPKRVSAGEKTLFREKAGAIALFSTTRLVFISGNAKLNKNIFDKNILKKKNGEYKTLGKIFTETKRRIDHPSGPRVNTRKFALLGDPALKLAYPKKAVKTTSLNEEPYSSNDTLKALQKVTLKGEIRNQNGTRDEDFDGLIYPTIYDQKVKLTTLANDPKSYKKTFKLRNSIIHDGKGKVENGKFNFSFVVPKDIVYTNGEGKISYYATDKKIDANGYSFINVGGTAQNPVVDNQPPEVKLYLNDRSFKDGGITGPSPLLIADIKDDYGINTAANGIGHQPQLIVDEQERIKIPNAYEASLDSGKTGSIFYKLKNLEPGNHYLKLKVWDIANNVGQAQISFLVKQSNEIVIEDFFNYPNPFSEKTHFQFSHNQDNKPLDMTLKIFDSRGKLQRVIKRKTTPEGNQFSELTWNGRNKNGKKLENGVYIYKIRIQNQEGNIQHSSNKLVIQK